MIRVLVVDDQALIRQAVVQILEHADGVEVVGQATDGQDGVQAAVDLVPDVVVMDIRMPRMDGIAATAAMCARAELGGTKVLILTTFEEDEYIVAALRAGASGFIGKGAEPEAIVAAVVAVAAGDALLSPAATRSLITRYVLPRPAIADRLPAEVPAQLRHLTDREREVLLLVARGLSNQEIADSLHISPHTAKTHVNRVMSKVYAHDRAQLVILAYESGLLAPGAG
ncbi:response regulator transcription factor [Microbacterium sp. RU33B]|uniref:response regulator transcription factor n=1 Tax=Microbacterium sp. RU33B TaxID=1907390 RepID=UPI000960B108|nr:response regulator transcription factor [Microbacterium sp. RU33B]SIT86804.1 two component transcriptional regulator, LuxR family [Microbacterium sp. RU33B]